MDIFERIKHYEYIHIVLWLIKDSCWMLGLKMLGTFMIIPTVGLAIIIVFHTRKTNDIFINLAILCWITANSFWMLTEFFDHLEYKMMAGIPFASGLLFVGIFYYKSMFDKKI
jgi:hypothetical protein